MNYYYCPGANLIHGQRVTIADRVRMRKAMKKKERMWKLF